ncbi:MAG: DUF4132 domain-containing protein, partial [Paracoccaceae bacterium]
MLEIAKLIPGSTNNIISRDLKRLNKVQKGLGETATTFVLKGSNETVLSTLAATATGDPLGVGSWYYFHGQEDIAQKRPPLFLDQHPYDTELMARYAMVLAASCKLANDTLLGSDKLPLALRVLFSEAAFAARDPRGYYPAKVRETPIKGLTTDRVVPMAAALQGTPADIFELLYWEAGEYNAVDPKFFRGLTDMKALLAAYGVHAIEGALRAPAKGRVSFVTDVGKFGLVNEDPFLTAILDLAGNSAKSVREAAIRVLRDVLADTIQPLATERLAKGTVAARSGMVNILASLGTKSANATLLAHAKTEKTARIVSAIENALSVADATSDADHDPDDASGYTAIDGSRVEIPALRPLTEGDTAKLSKSDRAAMRKLIEEENVRIDQINRENKARKFFHKRPNLSLKLIEDVDLLLLDKTKNQQRKGVSAVHFIQQHCSDLILAHLKAMPQAAALRVAFRSLYSTRYWMNRYTYGTFDKVIADYLNQPEADLRALDQLWQDMELEVDLGGWRKTVTRKAQKGDILRAIIPDESYQGGDPDDIAREALWPLLAENLDVLDHALGTGGADEIALDPVRAVTCLSAMPKVPLRALGPLLSIATGERKTGRSEARALLKGVPQVDERLVTLLDDSRQAVRASTADWMGTRGNTSAVAPLKKRLKKEKSELAKAAILTALQALGEPLDAFVGPTALIREAEAGLKKAKFDKLDYLDFTTLPPLKFDSGKTVPSEVPRWWIYLGFKLKQPGGNTLFNIYLDQLKPASAEALSQWVFDAWIAFDTVGPSDEEANAFAKKHADQRYQGWKGWFTDYTREQAFADLKREKMGEYYNSGAATKGVLAFAQAAPPQVVADRVRAYLRDHGSRTSQASSLLEVLAAKGDPVSLQVVIAAATRLKQKSVQAFAGTLIEAAAERMNWSMDELGDRVIPTAGLDDDGTLDLPCGPDEKPYRATLSEELTFVLQNPDGKVIKSLPAGGDDATKASKKQFTASKKELKQVVSMQSSRLYEALCAGRAWPVADWQRDFRGHPVMRRLTERIVWQGLDDDDKPQTCFRPTAEGDYTDAEDATVDPDSFDKIQIAHGATLESAETDAWNTHLKDYEVKSLFPQFGRPLLTFDAEQAEKTQIEDRKGWVLEAFQMRGVASKLNYDRGPAEDGGWFHEYRKDFNAAGITAVVTFTGNTL